MDEQKQTLLQAASFGRRIAEEERDDLSHYFVETDQWRRLFAGEIDVVYGAKGSGKSALYSLLVTKEDELLGRDILIVPGENPSGAPAFGTLVDDPPTSETEFVGLWKTYFLTLIASVLKEWGVETDEAKRVFAALEEAGLLAAGPLRARLQRVSEYVKRVRRVEAGISIDPNTGQPTGLVGRILIGEPDSTQAAAGFLSVDSLLRDANDALERLAFGVWIVLDRLDVAFVQHEDLEKNALRALFRAYLDMGDLDQIGIKIFLRTDIWKRIAAEGFREGSHITKTLTISWNHQSLRHLVVRRILKNGQIAAFYGVDPAVVFSDVSEQEALIQRMFPDQIDAGNNYKTFDWMVNRSTDGSGQPVPRELVHLLSALRDQELRRLELGEDPSPDEELFSRAAFKEALKEVSEVRLQQTLYSEYPDLQPYLEKLDGEKSEQSVDTLAKIWKIPKVETQEVAERLVEVGFFNRPASKDNPSFWVPFLYRDALNLVQGRAR
jgi:hypothetical protein